jgi:hypothetical protein
VAKLARLTHKIAIQLNLVAESCTIYSSRSRWSVRKLLDTPSYTILFHRSPLSSSSIKGVGSLRIPFHLTLLSRCSHYRKLESLCSFQSHCPRSSFVTDAIRLLQIEIHSLTQKKANAEKTKYMIMSRHLNSGQNQNIRMANESFENVATFKYWGTTLTNQNDIHDEMKSRLNSGNACYYSIQNLLSSRLTSKNLRLKYIKL